MHFLYDVDASQLGGSMKARLVRFPWDFANASRIEFASLSIARVHIAICVIAIFRVIKRNYLHRFVNASSSSALLPEWTRRKVIVLCVECWKPLKLIALAHRHRQINSRKHFTDLRIVSQIYFLYLWFPISAWCCDRSYSTLHLIILLLYWCSP